MPDIAVVGGGPKACALAAKTAVLSLRDEEHATLTIYEPGEIGASWAGHAGFTDGLQDLCTPALRDVGFPYDDPVLDAVGRELLSEFSWISCLISKELSFTYAEWVAKGCPPPSHLDFARYLVWVLRRAERLSESVAVIKESVTEIAHDGAANKWVLSCASQPVQTFDSVVVTGVKEKPTTLLDGEPGDWFSSGMSFWQGTKLAELRAFAQRQEESGEGNLSAVVIGNGGTAASIALYLGENLPNIDVTMVGSGLFLDSRPTNFFADRFFCDMEKWDELSLAQRKAFSGQLNSGAIWQQVVERLKRLHKLEYRIGYARNVTYTPDFAGDPMYRIAVSEERDFIGDVPSLPTIEGQIVVDATGFDPVWFRALLSDEVASLLNWDDPSTIQKVRDDCARDLSVNFVSADGTQFPEGFHVPMLGDYSHPGSPNLMALGSVADRILEKYRRS